MGPSLRKGSCGIRRMGMPVMHGAFRNGSAYAGRPGPVQLQMLHASRLLFPTEASVRAWKKLRSSNSLSVLMPRQTSVVLGTTRTFTNPSLPIFST